MKSRTDKKSTLRDSGKLHSSILHPAGKQTSSQQLISKARASSLSQSRLCYQQPNLLSQSWDLLSWETIALSLRQIFPRGRDLLRIITVENEGQNRCIWKTLSRKKWNWKSNRHIHESQGRSAPYWPHQSWLMALRCQAQMILHLGVARIEERTLRKWLSRKDRSARAILLGNTPRLKV